MSHPAGSGARGEPQATYLITGDNERTAAAILGVASIGEAIVLHEASTLAVVFNALRLLRFRTF